MALNILLVIVAYLLGSIPSAVWIGKRFYGIDVREHGSHNAGATNTLRTLGRRAALPVFAIDILKGFTAVMLSHLSGYAPGSDAMFNFKIMLVAAAVVGHIFPIFAGFKGGKGVATLAGAVAGEVTVLALSHYVSLSSMSAGIAFPIFIVLVFGERSASLIIFSCVIAVLLLLTHRKNIGRLIHHTESKIYLGKRKDA